MTTPIIPDLPKSWHQLEPIIRRMIDTINRLKKTTSANSTNISNQITLEASDVASLVEQLDDITEALGCIVLLLTFLVEALDT